MFNIVVDGEVIGTGESLKCVNKMFSNNNNIISVDLNKISFKNNNAESLFRDSTTITSVVNINDNITNMGYMFGNCINFVNIDKLSKNTNDLSRGFMECHNIVEVPSIPNSVTNLQYTFYNCYNLINAPVINYNANVTDMKRTYSNCHSLVNASIIPSNVTTMEYAFRDCYNLVDGPDMSQANNVTNMFGTFYNCQLLNNITSLPNNVINMYYTFHNCQNLVNAPEIPNSVTSMYETFSGCSNLVNAPEIPNSVVDMSGTFWWCDNLVNAPEIPSSVTNMNETFSGCYNLVNAPIIHSSVTSMNGTFNYCRNLVNAPAIPNSVTNMGYSFYSCTNLVNAPDMSNANSVTNMRNTFNWCWNMGGDINITSPYVTDATGCFDRTSLEKNVYIPYYTDTYDAFIKAGYTETGSINGVYMKEGVKYYVNDNEWTYMPYAGKLLHYNGESTTISVPLTLNNITINTIGKYGIFKEEPVVNVDLSNIPFENNSMQNAFYNCFDLTDVTNININVTDMRNTFYNCYNLVNVSTIPANVTDMSRTFMGCENLVNASEIPNSVSNMYATFMGCIRLVNVSEIPNSVTNMSDTFGWCRNLTNVPEIPNNVTDISRTFIRCYNLVNAPTIPSKVTNMSGTFINCYDLTGDIYINSPNVESITDCFSNTSLNKDVYIIKDIDGVNTVTYNTFINAGYSDSDRSADGVLLFLRSEIHPEEPFEGEEKTFDWYIDLSMPVSNSTSMTTVSSYGYNLSNVSEKIPSSYADRNQLNHTSSSKVVDYTQYVEMPFDIYGGRFKLTDILFDISKNGTDGGSVMVSCIIDDDIEYTLGTYPTIQRNNANPSFSEIYIDTSSIVTNLAHSSIKIRFYLYNQGNTKSFSLWNIHITGLLEISENNNAQ